jgi:hypothetical protein
VSADVPVHLEKWDVFRRLSEEVPPDRDRTGHQLASLEQRALKEGWGTLIGGKARSGPE